MWNNKKTVLSALLISWCTLQALKILRFELASWACPSTTLRWSHVNMSLSSQLASYFARDGLFFDTRRWLMANAWQLFQCLINCPYLLPQYMPTAFLSSHLHASNLPTAVWKSLRSKLFVLHVFLACVVSFQITKPGNVKLIWKIFRGFLDHEIIKREKFTTHKFLYLQY